MSITEKLANLNDVRLARIHSALSAKDWVYGSMYNTEQGVTMESWAQMVKREVIKRRARIVRADCINGREYKNIEKKVTQERGKQ